MAVTAIHHLTVVVADLARAVADFERRLGLTDWTWAPLQSRGNTARTRLGSAWLVLVEPQDPASVPGRHLAEHGEGLLLLSLETDSMQGAVDMFIGGGGRLSGAARTGLENWRVQDLAPEDCAGLPLQLCEEAVSR